MKRHSIQKLTFVFALILCAYSGTGCFGSATGGSDNSNPNGNSNLISSQDGGTVTSPDGKLQLVVPPGALDEDTEISISPIDGEEGAIGYEFLPDGLNFNQPAIATLKIHKDDLHPMVDEDGIPLDPHTVAPSITLFLKSADGSLEALDLHVLNEEDNPEITVEMEIPHFSSLVGSAGNAGYAYMSSLGTHYVGSDFKRDATYRYLGYSNTHSFGNMSLAYTVQNITINKLKFEMTGKAIKQVSPKELTRNSFLSKRGQESATRPKFNCDAVGSGTVKFTASGTSVVKVVFQPENKTRFYTVNVNETTTRSGKCIARISSRDSNFNNSGLESEERVALADPTQDTLVYADGELIPTEGMEVPSCVDVGEVQLALLDGNTLEANISMNGTVPNPLGDWIQYLNFSLLVLDPMVGSTGFWPLDDALWNLSLWGSVPGEEMAPTASRWEEGPYEPQEDFDLDTAVEDNMVSFLVPLSALGLSEEDALNNDYRIMTQLQIAPGYAYGGSLFFDTADIAF